ncbi:MAG: aspartate-semialdehyde dehydrogenase [Clostridiales bacterium]|nr:aspartate-semialdehyde dehydrogenase [Clostridiales bacterium]
MVNIAIVGATGLVGEKLTQILLQKMPRACLRLFGNTSVGNRVVCNGKQFVVEDTESLLTAQLDYAMFMATNEVSARYIPLLVAKGVTCIDNSSTFRLNDDVPLVVTCINGDKIGTHKLIANPNCSTIQVVIAINALKSLHPTKLTAVTYQAVSGAGKKALNDLNMKNGYGKLNEFRHPIYDNVIPLIGEIRKDGFTTEERKLTDESRKILELPHLKVNAFCARIPVSVGHSVFVNVRFKEKFNTDTVTQLLSNAPNILLLDDPNSGLYPMPMTLRNTKYVGVGRVTKDPTDNAVNFFVVADNLLRGAAYNAFEILKYCLGDTT